MEIFEKEGIISSIVFLLGSIIVTGIYCFLKYNIEGMVLGLIFGLVGGCIALVFERIVFKDRFLKISGTLRIIIKTIFYLILIGAIILTIEGFAKGFDYAGYLNKDQIIEFFLIFGLILLGSIISMVERVLGKGNLKNHILGLYHQPKEERRVFMFIDVKDSTTIAEKIGHVKFHQLLREFFFDISEIIVKRGGEIYNYVGDEIIVTWKEKRGVENLNCIRCYFEMKDRMHKMISKYYKKYHVFIIFKAGLHTGEVVTGEMGDYKREIVFLGDTVNTAARIQDECNVLKREILISGELLKELNLTPDIEKESMGWIRLKGKTNRVQLFSLKRVSTKNKDL